MDWMQVRDKISREAEAIRFTPAREVVRLFKYQIVPSGMGNLGQAFTTMVFAQGDCRCLNSYGILCLVRLAEDPGFELPQLRTMFREFVPLSAEFLSTCGLEKVWELVRDILGVLDSLETKPQYREIMDAMVSYTANLYHWIHHFFPYGVGALFPQRTREDAEQMLSCL